MSSWPLLIAPLHYLAGRRDHNLVISQGRSRVGAPVGYSTTPVTLAALRNVARDNGAQNRSQPGRITVDAVFTRILVVVTPLTAEESSAAGNRGVLMVPETVREVMLVVAKVDVPTTANVPVTD